VNLNLRTPQNTADSFGDEQVDRQSRQAASVPILFNSYEEHAHSGYRIFVGKFYPLFKE
jgi:hypothetical protein